MVESGSIDPEARERVLAGPLAQALRRAKQRVRARFLWEQAYGQAPPQATEERVPDEQRRSPLRLRMTVLGAVHKDGGAK